MIAAYCLVAFLAWLGMVLLICAFIFGATKGRDRNADNDVIEILERQFSRDQS